MIYIKQVAVYNACAVFLQRMPTCLLSMFCALANVKSMHIHQSAAQRGTSHRRRLKPVHVHTIESWLFSNGQLEKRLWLQVNSGDLFIYISKPDQDVGSKVSQALRQGAAAVMSSEPFEADEEVQVPVLLVPDCLQAQQHLGAAFYDRPSLKMNVVGVTGMQTLYSLIALCVMCIVSCSRHDRYAAII